MTYDLNFMAATTDPAEIPLVFDNRLCTGKFKLAQRALALFFNSRDNATMPFLGTYALNFLSGNIQGKQEITNQMTLAASRITALIQSTETSSTPSDERLKSFTVVVEDDESARDRLVLTFTLLTVSGETVQATLPAYPPITT